MKSDGPFNFHGHETRLFPSAHISSVREAEVRATASFLAMVKAVSEFGRKIVHQAGGPVGQLHCYTEVPFQLRRPGGKKPESIRPDGVLTAIRGKRRWSALLEVKVGKNPLGADQVNKYHKLARQEGFDAVITISNQPAQANGLPPLALDGRRLRSIPVAHFSWERLLSEAQMLSRKKAVSDVDQQWMLDEWIRYIDDPASKIVVPVELGPHWNNVLKAARTGALTQKSPELRDVVAQWIGYLRQVSLRMRAKLGVDVRPKISRADRITPATHVDRLVAQACTKGFLSGTVKIPDAAGDLRVEVFLHSKTVRYSVAVRPPTEGRQKTRLAWLARQLRRSPRLPGGLAVEVQWTKRGVFSASSTDKVIEDPAALLVNDSGAPIPKDLMPKRYVVQLTTKLPRGEGRSSAAVLDGLSKALERFYRGVVEQMVPFVPKAPQLPERPVDGPDDGDSIGSL